jgi:TetR/AcrR family transcriptional regulator
MPKQTFFNLPDDKREQIVQVAIDEFAENDYDNVSISRIVARAGIAKGSFYQYFDGKEDLYGYLIGLLAEAKRQYLSLDHPDPAHIGIFAYLRWTAEVGIGFELAYPRLTKVGLSSMSTGGFPTAIDAQVREATQAFYRQLVETGQRQGDIAAGLDPGLAAVIFEAVLTSAGHYIMKRALQADPALLVRSAQHTAPDAPDAHEGAHYEQGAEARLFLERPEVKELFARTMDILEHGMGVKHQQSEMES